MDIEVSGTPQPNVTWYKDDKLLHEANISTHKITSSGNCYTLVIEKGKKISHISNCFNNYCFYFFLTVCKQDAGKYIVKAINEAGETQSIADFIIMEPTPERIVDIVKTVAIENIDGHRVCIIGI